MVELPVIIGLEVVSTLLKMTGSILCGDSMPKKVGTSSYTIAMLYADKLNYADMFRTLALMTVV